MSCNLAANSSGTFPAQCAANFWNISGSMRSASTCFHIVCHMKLFLPFLAQRTNQNLSIVRGGHCFRCCYLCPHRCCKLFTFSSSREPFGPISTKLGTKHPWMKGIRICSMKGFRSFPRGDNYEIVKIHWQFSKIFFRTSRPIATKLGPKHPWVKRIQNCSNEGFCSFFQGEKIMKLRKYIDNFRKSSSEHLGQFQPNLAQSILGWREFKIVLMKGSALFSKGRKLWNCENTLTIFENLLPNI